MWRLDWRQTAAKELNFWVTPTSPSLPDSSSLPFTWYLVWPLWRLHRLVRHATSPPPQDFHVAFTSHVSWPLSHPFFHGAWSHTELPLLHRPRPPPRPAGPAADARAQVGQARRLGPRWVGPRAARGSDENVGGQVWALDDCY